ncbi:MAG: type I restriction enzyme HsdR N-terminal domain-containing protein [Flavisolibacter sp.]
MIAVDFPKPEFRIKKEENLSYLFDPIRKIWVLLTQEEWVRQNFVSFLTGVLHYPLALIAIEKEIKLNDMKKRFDILIYDKNHLPWMMVECKAPAVKLTGKTLQQLLRYNISVPVDFLIITNGKITMGWQKEATVLKALKKMPIWQSL